MSDMTVNTARSSDLARRALEAHDEAQGPLSLYGMTAEDGFAPVYVHSMESLILRARRANPSMPRGIAWKRVSDFLITVTRRELYRLGSVSLDFDGVSDRSWAVYDPVNGVGIPQVAFGALPDASSLFSEGVCEAIAVYYVPPETPRRVVNRVTGEEELWTNDFDASGYLGILRTFHTVTDADEARQSLAGALAAIKALRRADEPDAPLTEQRERSEWVI